MSEHRPSNRYDVLLQRLTDGTQRGTLQWTSTPYLDTFVAILHNGTVRVARREEPDEHGAPMEWFELEIAGKSGQVAERLSSDPALSGRDSVQFDGVALANLYRLARKSATSADALIDQLVSELA